MTTKTATRTPADRQAARAQTWAVELMSAPATFAGIHQVQAPDRQSAWDVGYKLACDLNARYAGQTVPQGVSLAPLTQTEYATVRAFLDGNSVRLRADRATGLESVEPRRGRVYVHDLYTPRELTELDPETMARAGAAMDRYRSQGTSPSPITGKVYVTESQQEARAIRCAQVDVPEAFQPTGRLAVWGWWPENTSPTFPTTEAGRARGARLARLMDGSRASLRLEGVTIATTHSVHTGSGGEHGPPLLRVLTSDAIETMGPRAVRIATAVQSIARMHKLAGYDIEQAHTPAELDYSQADPRDGTMPPMLRAQAPTMAELYPEEETFRGDTLRMQAPHDRIGTRLRWEAGERWKLAAENPAHFTTDPAQADPDDLATLQEN